MGQTPIEKLERAIVVLTAARKDPELIPADEYTQTVDVALSVLEVEHSRMQNRQVKS